MAVDAQVGTEVPPLVIESVSAERMKTVAALLNDSNPIHFDVESVKALGMGDRVVNQGPNNMGVRRDDARATGPVSPGRVRGLRVRFLGNVFAGDRLTARGTVTGVAGGGRRALRRPRRVARAGRGRPRARRHRRRRARVDPAGAASRPAAAARLRHGHLRAHDARRDGHGAARSLDRLRAGVPLLGGGAHVPRLVDPVRRARRRAPVRQPLRPDRTPGRAHSRRAARRAQHGALHLRRTASRCCSPRRVASGLAVGLFTGAGTAALTELVPPGGDTRRAATHAATTAVAGFAMGPLIGGDLRAVRAVSAPARLRRLASSSCCRCSSGSSSCPRRCAIASPSGSSRAGSPLRAREGRRSVSPRSSSPAASRAPPSSSRSARPLRSCCSASRTSSSPPTVAVCFLGSSALAQIGMRGRPIRTATLSGLVLLPAGFRFRPARAASRTAGPLFVVGALVGGFGQGLAYLGGQSLVEKVAPPDQRSEVFSLYMIVLYVSGSIAAITFGLMAKWIGLDDAALLYAGFVVTISAVHARGHDALGPASSAPRTARPARRRTHLEPIDRLKPPARAGRPARRRR